MIKSPPACLKIDLGGYGNRICTIAEIIERYDKNFQCDELIAMRSSNTISVLNWYRLLNAVSIMADPSHEKQSLGTSNFLFLQLLLSRSGDTVQVISSVSLDVAENGLLRILHQLNLVSLNFISISIFSRKFTLDTYVPCNKVHQIKFLFRFRCFKRIIH